MLKVYSATWCPHCSKTIRWLEENKIVFEVVNIETAPKEVIAEVVKANGGDDWVVPTLEFDGKWREGKAFNADGLRQDLIKMGAF